jgi:hypothetical protein
MCKLDHSRPGWSRTSIRRQGEDHLICDMGRGA